MSSFVAEYFVLSIAMEGLHIVKLVSSKIVSSTIESVDTYFEKVLPCLKSLLAIQN